MAEMMASEQANEHWLRGNDCVSEKDIDNAILEFKKVLLLDPDFPQARDSLARCTNDIALRYSNNGDPANSVAEYSKAIILARSVDFPKELFSVLYFNRGVGYRTLGDYKKALEDFLEAGRLNPADPDCKTNELAARARKGSKPYVSFIPSNAADYIKRGKGYLQKGAHDNAIADFNDAIILDPKNADAYEGRSEAYKSMGNYDKAIADCDKAISLRSYDPSFYKTRGEAYRGKGDNEKANADFKDAEKWQSIKEDRVKKRKIKALIFAVVGAFLGLLLSLLVTCGHGILAPVIGRDMGFFSTIISIAAAVFGVTLGYGVGDSGQWEYFL
jgi:tetratricopeptide (TPR) repeat protein